MFGERLLNRSRKSTVEDKQEPKSPFTYSPSNLAVRIALEAAYAANEAHTELTRENNWLAENKHPMTPCNDYVTDDTRTWNLHRDSANKAQVEFNYFLDVAAPVMLAKASELQAHIDYSKHFDRC